jgi:DNA ligase (NAD+)
MNGNCPGILLKKFNAFVSKTAMDIDGLSGKTLEKLVDNGTLVKYSDIYRLRPCDIMTLPGFGNKSTQKLLQAIHDSKNTTLQKVLTGLNIDNVGKKVAEQVSKLFNNDPQLILQEFSWIDAEPVYRKLSSVEGFGDTIVWSIINWFNNEDNFEEFKTLVSVLNFEQNSKQTGTNLNGMKFVITGSVTKYKNRDELANVITSNGGIVQSGVNKETTYLINNDVNSTSSKNKKAKELGVKIISEDDFIQLLGTKPKNTSVKKGLF